MFCLLVFYPKSKPFVSKEVNNSLIITVVIVLSICVQHYVGLDNQNLLIILQQTF